jgi:hypothetical protein
MKTLFTLLSIPLFFFIACKKDTGSSNNPTPTPSTIHLTAQLNGTATSFNTNVQALWVADTINHVPVKDLQIIGYTTAGAGFLLEIDPVTTTGKIAAGTYIETNITAFVCGGLYAPITANVTTSAYLSGLNPSTTNPFQIIITSVDTSGVKGTFKGDTFFENLSVGISSVDITKKTTFANGDFYAKF